MTLDAPPGSNQPSIIPEPNTWVSAYGDLLFRYAQLRVRDVQTAEELVQETFLAALQGLNNFSRQSNFGTWLVGILKHKLIDHLRRQARETPLDLEPDTAIDAMFNPIEHWRQSALPRSWRQSPEMMAQQTEAQQALKLCIESLPERYRQAFIMRVMDESDTADICKNLGLTPNNLYMVLHRARLRLRACLEDKGIGDTTG
ncbi:MAG: sigma-70 family RNA polymerase sigma factor [Planctomycetia bacterium]|nr:sigma-70 family RNA polymerase sigma factor [Planctomycetia bacterium]